LTAGKKAGEAQSMSSLVFEPKFISIESVCCSRTGRKAASKGGSTKFSPKILQLLGCYPREVMKREKPSDGCLIVNEGVFEFADLAQR
jgi:hypothetical protein